MYHKAICNNAVCYDEGIRNYLSAPGARFDSMGLSNKQEAFVNEYLTCWNTAEAARRAGYSAKTARQQGSRLLTNVDIQAAIAARLDELKMGADEVLTRLTDHARGTMRDFLRVDKGGEPVLDLRKAAETNRLHLVKKFKKTTRTIKNMTETVVEIELYDAQAALVQLGRHHRLFADRLEVDWRAELEAAGLNPDAQYESLVEEFRRHIEAGAPANAGGGDGGGEAAFER